MTSLSFDPLNQQPDGGCAEINSRSSRRCSLTSLPAGKADCRRIASRFSRCSVLTEDLPSVGVGSAALPGGLAYAEPVPKSLPGGGPLARLAARQVKGRHLIQVIRVLLTVGALAWHREDTASAKPVSFPNASGIAAGRTR